MKEIRQSWIDAMRSDVDEPQAGSPVGGIKAGERSPQADKTRRKHPTGEGSGEAESVTSEKKGEREVVFEPFATLQPVPGGHGPDEELLERFPRRRS